MPVPLRILAIMLLRAGPQDLPYSRSLFVISTFLYLASGVLVLTTAMSSGQAVANMVLDVVVLLAFSYFCLSLLKYKARFVQMVTALAGIQRELLDKAATMIKPHGKICYSTCSIQAGENKEVVKDFLQRNHGFKLQTELLTLPSANHPDHDGGYAAIITKK